MDTAAYHAYTADRQAPGELEGPWRRAALLAVGVAAVELIALIAVLVAIVVRPFTTHTPAAHHAQPAVKPAPVPAHHVAPRPAAQLFTAAVLPRAHTHVLVLNGNGRGGAAAAEASTLRAHGYPVPVTGNADRTDYATTIVMYRPGFSREAKRLAHDVGVSVVAPLDGARDARSRRAQLVEILGR